MTLLELLKGKEYFLSEEFPYLAQDCTNIVWAYREVPKYYCGYWGGTRVSDGSKAYSVDILRDLAKDWSSSVVHISELSNKTEGHPHAEIMREYAEVALTNPEPWTEFEQSSGGEVWYLMQEVSSFDNTYYRRKPKTIEINGYQVPKPLKETPEVGTNYWLVLLYLGEASMVHTWEGYEAELLWLERGLLHLTKEAATLHAKALLGFTENI